MMLRWSVRAVTGIVVLVLLLATGRTGLVLTSRTDDRATVQAQLRFVGSALDRGAARRMQELFPEGFFFSHVLYGLAWTGLAADGRSSRVVAAREARKALARLRSPEGAAVFSAGLEPRYGVFYAGWSLLLRAETAAIDPGGVSDRERAGIAADADAIAEPVRAALDAGGSPFLEAYPGMAWPVDTVVAMAALLRADAVTGRDRAQLPSRWRAAAWAHRDPRTNLLAHQVDPVTGEVLEGARGSSQSLIQRFWPRIDPDGAALSYERFRANFRTTEFGITGVREYPHGVEGVGDVDSGPLVFGMSASASAVAIGAAQANGDHGWTRELNQEAEVVGFPLEWNGRRRYLGGVLPVGDAFVAWARAAPRADAVEHPASGVWWPCWLAVPWTLAGAAILWRSRRGAKDTLATA